MNDFQEEKIPRIKIGTRLIFTLLCLIVLYVVQFVIQIVTLLQYAILLITRSYSGPLRKFANQAATYNYRLVRYITINENTRPFPFSHFPSVIDEPEETVKFD